MSSVIAQNTFNFKKAVEGVDVFAPITGSGFTFPNFLRVTIQALFIMVTISSFLFLLIGAVQWIMAGGEKEGIEKARRKITNAIIGLAIAFSIYAIASLVNVIFGVEILNDLFIPTL